jgi:hypothetical protein
VADGIRLDGSDEWVMAAIRLAEGKAGATLQDVIAAGDAINHAIFTPQELRKGFAELLAAGWVECRGDRWRATEAGRGVHVRGRSEWAPDPRLQDPRWNHPLSDAEYEAALRSYLGRP